MVRTAKECVTVLTVLVATTSTEAACVSQVSMVRSAETGCVHLESMGCTVKTPVSARTNTHSGERLLLRDERQETRSRSLFFANFSFCQTGHIFGNGYLMYLVYPIVGLLKLQS